MELHKNAPFNGYLPEVCILPPGVTSCNLEVGRSLHASDVECQNLFFSDFHNIYRLINVYYLMRENLDKLMHPH